eukprot:CAMPEP_0177702958 /NCGR_PEP_ID=MMETSP0484_2-20121128/7417_1 /TAXON_ID=354590 /ORGANISM="Rhodomonas lens, Strain RHODO" /LENGTH=147 /DNA_ID=CAMNT_0019214283 /DNA_START=941 /DNA_END=1381 /DNA_ORIENTATION=+
MPWIIHLADSASGSGWFIACSCLLRDFERMDFAAVFVAVLASMPNVSCGSNRDKEIDDDGNTPASGGARLPFATSTARACILSPNADLTSGSTVFKSASRSTIASTTVSACAESRCCPSSSSNFVKLACKPSTHGAHAVQGVTASWY